MMLSSVEDYIQTYGIDGSLSLLDKMIRTENNLSLREFFTSIRSIIKADRLTDKFRIADLGYRMNESNKKIKNENLTKQARVNEKQK